MYVCVLPGIAPHRPPASPFRTPDAPSADVHLGALRPRFLTSPRALPFRGPNAAAPHRACYVERHEQDDYSARDRDGTRWGVII